MKSIFKLFCVVLSLCFLFTFVSGCEKEQEPETTTTKATTTSGEPVELRFYKPIFGDQGIDTPNAKMMQEEFLERLNIKLILVGPTGAGAADQMQSAWLMFASNEQIDILRPSGYFDAAEVNLAKLIDQDLIIPLNDLLESHGQDILANVNQVVLNRYCKDKEGNIWTIPYEDVISVQEMLAIRSDWLEKNNLEVPKTLAEFENVMKVFKEKENDTGMIVSYPQVLTSVFTGMFIPTGMQNYLDTDGSIKPYFTHPGFIDYLEKMNEWYEKGWIMTDYATIGWAEHMEVASRGTAGVYAGHWSAINTVNNNTAAGTWGTGAIYFAPVTPPEGPAGNLQLKSIPFGSDTISITKMCKNPEKAMEFINYTSGTEEGYMLALYGIENVHWKWVDKANKVMEPIADAITDNGYGYFYTEKLDKVFSKITMNTPFWKDFFAPLKLFVESPDYPADYSVDYMVSYDQTIMKSKDKQTDMTTLIQEAIDKIIMGTSEVSSFEDTLNTWYSIGGTDYIDDLTTQYKAQQ
jgi:putative aldouronate transport system substrate-binding protein